MKRETKRTIATLAITMLTVVLLFKGLPWVAVVILVLVMIPDELYWRRK